MTDKIITTFETTLTWYDPFDKIPEKDTKILVKMKNGNIHTQEYWEFLEPYLPQIKWWAKFPEFD